MYWQEHDAASLRVIVSPRVQRRRLGQDQAELRQVELRERREPPPEHRVRAAVQRLLELEPRH